MSGLVPLTAPLNPEQQALYARLAIANMANQGVPSPSPSPNPPPTPGPIPPPQNPPGQPLPPPDLSNAVAMSNQAPPQNIYAPTGPNANAASKPVPMPPQPGTPGFDFMPVPGHPGQVIPQAKQLQTIQQMYADSPQVQQAMTALAGDQPQYKSPTYHPPNKWTMLATALLGLAFPAAPIAKFAAGFAGGEEAGAEARFKREQDAAAAQYESEVNQQSADEKQAQLAIQFDDAQASIAERKIRDQAMAEATRVRLEQGWARVGQGAERLGLDRDRLTQQYQLAQQRFSVIMRGQDITAHDKVLDANTRLITSQITQLGADRRAMMNADVRTAVSQAQHIQQTLDQNLIGIREQVQKGKMKPEVAQTAVTTLEQAASSQITGLLDKGTTGTKLDGISSLASGLNSGMLQDDENAANAQYGGGYGGGGYPSQYEPGAPPVTVNVNTGGQDGNVYGGTLHDPNWGFVNQPLGGPGQPANQSGGQRQAEETHQQNLAAQQQAYQQHLTQLAAGANLGKGPGIAEPTFKQAREYAAQHASDFPTAQSLLSAMTHESPQMAQQLSGQQAAQILETWAHTRRGQGLGVDIAPPPGQAQPQAPAPSASSGPGGLDITKPGLGLTPQTAQVPAPKEAPQTGQSPGPQPTVGETAVAAAQKVGIPPQLVLAVMRAESSGNQGAVSSTGAIGRMQLEPGTAQSIGVDPHNPYGNVYGGAYYLAEQLKRFGSIPLALAAYNAGPNAVIQSHGIPRAALPYVTTVLQYYRELMRTSSAQGNF